MNRNELWMTAAAVAVTLACGCAGVQATPARPSHDSGVRGRVLLKGEGAEGAYVYAYASTSSETRGPTKLISAATSKDGAYTLNCPPGSYYVVARKRASGSPTGYLGEGDFEGMSKSNPVIVQGGAFTPLDLPIAEIPGKFLLAPYSNVPGGMGITGKVIKADGSPCAGAYVMVYTRRDRIGRPAFLSATDEQGKYAIYPTKPGTYYVAARGSYGDLPRKGEPYGTYDKDPDHKVDVKESTVLEGVDITMNKFTRDLTKCAEH